jgi:hypothetical protein
MRLYLPISQRISWQPDKKNWPRRKKNNRIIKRKASPIKWGGFFTEITGEFSQKLGQNPDPTISVILNILPGYFPHFAVYSKMIRIQLIKQDMKYKTFFELDKVFAI